MSLQNVKARIKTLLEGVNGIGKVFTGARHFHEEAQTPNFAKDSVLNAWFITRESSALTDMNQNRSKAEQRDMILVRGFYAFKDSVSDEAFDTLVDAVVAAINTDRKPPVGSGTYFNNTVKQADPPAVRVSDFRTFGPQAALCHHVEIIIPVVYREI